MQPGKARAPGRSRLLAAIVGLALLAAACGGGGSDDQSAESSPPAAAGPAEWQTLEVTDANGDTFSIDDLVGRPVFVENFATWCSNCRKQLGDTQDAAERAGDEAVFVALSVETELDGQDMKDYAADNGFSDIRFAVMSPEMLAAMSDAYGNSALNAPSTPKVKVEADGAAGKLVTGYESTGEILGGLGLG
ncbi:MAG TPA: TlpA disulfide reductase family protein [Acidimicrobiia bacterium]|nr:TlpA disulfide reductase family protein [Acidimicrobiia bacterium]